ncbi:AI-2E family transporter [Nocardioides islandensis]|uniref:AI-2E family transporter n=1 Tax=Nocardioides islandensis TaxID=433663 RepID=A0A930VG53_9ACTN|nr:AI-2E family transporter [Nocardioides islandensis]MBF4764318.1 AI-2E family transporter [Nocardioides islandensis]
MSDTSRDDDLEDGVGDDGSGERLTGRIAQQWHQISQLRAERRTSQPPEPVVAGSSNFSRAHVPWGVDLTAAWAWRFLVIAAAAYLIARMLGFLMVIVLPVVVAMFIAALVEPVVSAMTRRGVPRGLAAGLMVIVVIGSVVTLLTVAGNQVANGAQDLADSVSEGVAQITDWLKNGPLHASDSQINDYLDRAQEGVSNFAKDGEIFSKLSEVGTAVGHVLAGFFIVLFSTYFFLADGERIWAWFVRLSPRASRVLVDGSGRVAWVSLTQFVRATVIVAATDALGVMIVATILGVPFVMAIGVLVFLGAFVPMVGAFVAGTVAVMVALVDQGPITALFMLGGVVLVQQIEGHVLQPFLMGRFVSVHPLGVIVAIGIGVVVAGIPGALIAVPLAATGNAVAQHLAANTRPGDDPEEELERDYDADGERPPDVVTDDEGAPVEPEERDPGYGNRRGTDPSAPPSDPPEEGNP